MLFNSPEFILAFLPLSVLVYFGLTRMRWMLGAKFWLLGTSLVFYGWWKIEYVPLIIGTILFNFTMGTFIGKPGLEEKTRKRGLLLGICANVLLLGYYKYTNFLLGNLNAVADTHFPVFDIVLPLGISFFTFTQIAFLVDTYRSRSMGYGLPDYSLFVLFFPHLLAGPIIHHSEMMPQFRSLRNRIPNEKNLASGLYLFTIGLFKKVVVADTFAIWANRGFDVSTELGVLTAWATSLSYTFQLYFDFSGYTDMALGAALMFNIKLPQNFNSPYKALDIQDFWRRWHITLSRFLRDYIYIPLGGNRISESRTLINLFLTFLIGGLWHGAGWTFVAWGALHGAALVIHRLWQKVGFSLPRPIAWFITFNFVNVAWVFFRATTWQDAFKVLKGMIGLTPHPGPFLDELKVWKNVPVDLGIFKFGSIKDALAVILVFAVVSLLFKNSNQLAGSFNPSGRTLAVTVFCLFWCMVLLLGAKESQFLYFNF